MKKNSISLLALCVAILLLSATLLTACGSTDSVPETEANTTAESTTDKDTTEEPVAEETKNEPVTIEFWHNYDAGAGQIDLVDELIADFESQYDYITVEPLYLEWSALKNNVITGATTGELPDVLRGDIGFVPQFQSLDVLVELDTTFSDYDTVSQNILSSANSTASSNGHFYGLAANTNTKILYYNKALVETEPTSLDDMWTIAESVSTDEVTGFCEAWLGGWNVCQYIWSNGGDVLSPDNTKADGYINSDIAIAVIQKMADLHAAGAFNGPSIDPGAPGDTDGLGAGTYAMTIDGPWKANDLINKYPDMEFGMVQMPAGSAGSVGVLGGEDFMLFKSSEDAEQKAAWEFVKYMTEKDAQISMAQVGQMPVNNEALASSEAIEAMPLLPIFSEALKTCKSRPVTPYWGDITGIINTKATEAVLGLKPVEDALNEAATEIDTILSN